MRYEQLFNRKNIGRNLLMLVAGCISMPLLWVTIKALEKRKKVIRKGSLSHPETSISVESEKQ